MSKARQLGQVKPSNTNATLLFSPTDNKPYRITAISVVNNGGGAVATEIYHDVDGTTWDSTTVIAKQSTATDLSEVLLQDLGVSGRYAAGSIAVKSSTANRATFTIYGIIEGETL
tara:strand:+ start:242 stop:586 length:345 start_codon:yes stop_codon:yes gene_type:complete